MLIELFKECQKVGKTQFLFAKPTLVPPQQVLFFNWFVILVLITNFPGTNVRLSSL